MALDYRHGRDVWVDSMKRLVETVPSIPLPWWPELSGLLGGLRMNELTLLCAPTGCLGGDSRIRINRAKKGGSITIRELYQRFNGISTDGSDAHFDRSIPTYVRSYDGTHIRLHKVKDVFLSGIKETWELRADQHTKLRLTPCHKVLTQRGWIAARDLIKDEDKIAMDSNQPQKSGRKRVKLNDTYFVGMRHHPFATKANEERRLVKHRAIYEANDNGLELKEYLDICRHYPEKAKTLKFINPATHHVHHKDENHYNNDPANLEILAADEHLKLHGDYSHFNQGTIRWVTFRGFEKIGVEAVYDIECEEPYHNFVANGLVVHNSGKTALLSNLATQLFLAKVPTFVAPVETGDDDFLLRMLSCLEERPFHNGQPTSVAKAEQLTQKWAKTIAEAPLYISTHDNRVEPQEMANMLYYMHQTYGVKVALLDNLNFFLKVTSSQMEKAEMDNTIHEFVILAKKLPMHIILVVHPRKTDGGRVLSEFDIKGSSTAVQEASNVLLFNRAEESDIESGRRSWHDRELIFRKIRKRGENVGKSAWLTYRQGRYVETESKIGGPFVPPPKPQAPAPSMSLDQRARLPYSD